MLENVIIQGLNDRRAQVECAERVIETIKNGGKDFLAELCVGAGKTNAALGIMKWLKDRTDEREKFVVVVPNEVIRQHWVADAKNFGINLSGQYDGRAIRNLFNDGFGEALDGIVISYQVLCKSADLIEQIIGRLNGRCFVFLDEVHHGGDGLAWGNAAITAFSGAAFRLGLTGTPYRHDTAPMPWVRYAKTAEDSEGHGVVVPQYHYRYGNGLSDQIVAPIDFQWVGGCVERSSVGEDFEDDLPNAFDFDDTYEDITPEAQRERMMNKRLSIALSANNAMLTQDENGLVCRVIAALVDAKQLYARAGAAIICDTMAQLNVIHEELTRRGIEVRYTTHRDASSDNVVRDFNAGQGDVLLSIRQLAEGVSIPRLQVLGLAMTTTTQLFFTQVVGRLARLIPGLPYTHQHGTTIAMRDPRLVAHAESFKNHDLEVEQRKAPLSTKICSNCHAEVAMAAKECPECGHAFGHWPSPTAKVEDHTGSAQAGGMTLDGRTYSEDELVLIETEIESTSIYTSDPWFAAMPRDAQLRLFIAARNAQSKSARGV